MHAKNVNIFPILLLSVILYNICETPVKIQITNFHLLALSGLTVCDVQDGTMINLSRLVFLTGTCLMLVMTLSLGVADIGRADIVSMKKECLWFIESSLDDLVDILRGHSNAVEAKALLATVAAIGASASSSA